VIVLTVFIDITGYGIIIPLLPFYADEFQAGPTALGILIASFAIMQFFFSPLLGKTSDRKGRKPIMLVSLLLSLISFAIARALKRGRLVQEHIVVTKTPEMDCLVSLSRLLSLVHARDKQQGDSASLLAFLEIGTSHFLSFLENLFFQ